MYYHCGYKDHSRPPSGKLPYIYGCYVTIWEPKVTHVFGILCDVPPHICHPYCVWMLSVVTPIGLLWLHASIGLQGFLVSLSLIYLLWWASKASHRASSLSIFMGVLLICSKRPHMGLLNSITNVLGSPAPTGVDCICNNARLISWIVSIQFYCAFDKFDACFYLAIALDMMWYSFLQNFLKVSDVKFILASETILLGSPNSLKIILTTCSRSCTDRLATILQLGTYCNNLQDK